MLCITMEKYCMIVNPLKSAMKRERLLSDICTKTAPRILYLHLIYALFFCHIAGCCRRTPAYIVPLPPGP